jgi:hypothetical protein
MGQVTQRSGAGAAQDVQRMCERAAEAAEVRCPVTTRRGRGLVANRGRPRQWRGMKPRGRRLRGLDHQIRNGLVHEVRNRRPRFRRQRHFRRDARLDVLDRHFLLKRLLDLGRLLLDDSTLFLEIRRLFRQLQRRRQQHRGGRAVGPA